MDGFHFIWKKHHNGHAPVSPPTLHRQDSLQDYLLASSPPAAKWCLSGLSLPVDNGRSIAVAFKKRVAVAVTDGSYKDSYSSAAWIIESDTFSRMSGRVITPEEEKSHSSYRSELSGLYPDMYLALKVCQFLHYRGGNPTGM